MKLKKDVKEGLLLTLGTTGVFAVILMLACLAPFLLIWSVNTLAEASGTGFRIAHGVWSYVAAIVFLALVRGGR
jgi:hypothetical protein